MELIIGHNGLERIGLGGKSRNGGENNLTDQKQDQGQMTEDFSRDKGQGWRGS